MKMAGIEKFLIRSRFRVYFQRKFEAPRVLADIDVGDGGMCLEIGCGHGAGTLLINQYLNPGLVVGVDVDPDMIEAAKRYISRPPKWARQVRTDNIEFLCQDATELSFSDCCFDAVFLFGVLDHIKEWPKVISEVFRVLKAGGIFSFEDFLLPGSSDGRLGHIPILGAELKDTLEGAGFSIQSFKVTKLLHRCLVRAVKDSCSPGGEQARG